VQMTKRWLLIAAVLLLLGLTIALSALAFHWGDWQAFSTTEPFVEQDQAYSVDQIQRIRIRMEDCDVRLVRSQDDQLHAVWYEGERTRFSMEVLDDHTLEISEEPHGWSGIQIDLSATSYTLLLEIPDGYVGPTEISSGSGEIAVRDLTLEGDLSCTTGSGDVDLREMLVRGTLLAESASGEIQMNSVSAATSASIISASGDQTLTRLQMPELTISTASGELELNQIQVGGSMSVQTTSGDIEWRELDAITLTVSTTSGEVTGLLSERYRVSAESASGDVTVTVSPEGDRTAEIDTVSGDIEIGQL
jgi:DUF4097 and DUF4098 domain-containing protein YvlB